jgi:hypothetical protein
MHIGGRNIENLHINTMLKDLFFWKDINLILFYFLCLFILEWIKQIIVLNCPNDNLQVIKSKVVLIKPSLLNQNQQH